MRDAGRPGAVKGPLGRGLDGGAPSNTKFGYKTKRSRESTLAETGCRKMYRGFLLTWASVAIPSQNPEEILMFVSSQEDKLPP